MAVDRNTQLNPQGDPAKEAEFVQNQEPRTSEGARASEPQLAGTLANEELIETIKGADILDPTQAKGYEADDAKPGQAQGANVNADFEDDVRTGADASGEQGDEGEDGTVLTSGYFNEDDPEKGPQQVTLGGKGGDVVETGDEARDDSKKKKK